MNGLITDSLGKAKAFNSKFRQVFTEENMSTIPEKEKDHQIPHMDHIRFTTEGVEKPLRNLYCKKASDPDKIPTVMLKQTASQISGIVSFIFSQSYGSGQFTG